MVAIDMPKGHKKLSVNQLFNNGSVLKDYYSGTLVEVKNNQVIVGSPFEIVLLGAASN